MMLYALILSWMFLMAQSRSEKLNLCPELEPFCFCENVITIDCSRFDRLEELDQVLNQSETYTMFRRVRFLIINPRQPIPYNHTLNVSNLNFTSDSQINLRNFNGFDVNVPLFVDERSLRDTILSVANSTIKFYSERVDIDTIQLCNSIRTVSPFSPFEQLVLSSGNTYTRTCVRVLNGVELMNVFITSPNRLSFFGSKSAEHRVKINTLTLIDGDVNLNGNLLDPNVFENLTELLLVRSTLGSIEVGLFKSFARLDLLILDLRNFGQFFADNVNWISDMDETGTKQGRLEVVLSDSGKKFTFADEHFCSFRNFPRRRAIYPILVSGDELKCSCTMAWLIEPYFNTTEEIFKTSTVSDCFKLTENEFRIYYDECNFDERIARCPPGSPPVISSANRAILSFHIIGFISIFYKLFII